MHEEQGDTDLQPVTDDRPVVPPSMDPMRMSAAGATELIGAICLGTWTAVMIGLVRAGALQIAPAIVLILLATIVVSVEVRRARRRMPRRNRFGELTETRIEPSEMKSLLEIEQASMREERRVLLAREFCRLASDALRADPAAPHTWPDADTMASWRAQIGMLVASAADRSAERLPPGRPTGNISDAELADAIEALRQYVERLSRLQRIATYDPQPLRELTRYQHRLQTLQDQIISRLREPTSDGE